MYVAVLRDAGCFIERMTTRVANDSPQDFCSVDSAVRFGGTAGSAASLEITGLDHLEAQQVWFTAKGNVPQGPYVVNVGRIFLDVLPTNNAPSGVIGFTGVRFTPELEVLDAISTETRTKQKTVVSIGFEVDNGRGVSVGQDFDNLIEWQQNQVSDGYTPPPPASDLVVSLVPGNWDVHGRACLRQTKPLPVTVLGIVRNFKVGG